MSEKKTDVKKVDAQEKKKALSDYDRHLAKVRVQKAMTDTEAWRSFYSAILLDIRHHANAVLDAEKQRDVIQHQEGVKILRQLLFSIRKPVENLNAYILAMPLFAQDMSIRAVWNEALGTIELKSIK